MYIIITSFVFLVLVFWLTRKSESKRFFPPKLPGSLPVIGIGYRLALKDTKGLFKLFVELGHTITSQGGVCHTQIGPIQAFGITDPDDIVTILNTCLEKNWIYGFCKSWVGDGLFSVTSNIPLWKRHRKIISRSFSPQILFGYLDIMNKEAMQLLQVFEAHVNRGAFEHMHLIEEITMGTIYQTTMGFDEEEMKEMFDKNHTAALKSILNIIARRVQSIWLHVDLLYKFSSLKKEEDEILIYLHKMSNAILSKKLKNLKNGKVSTLKFKSFLDLLLELPPEEAFSDEEIRQEVDTMIVAGVDTTSTTLTFALILIGSHPDVQEKIYEELTEVFEGSKRDVNKYDLQKLVYLEAVLMETLRLYPITPVLLRYAAEEVKLKNYTIPAGSSCLLLTYSMHRDPAVWGADAADFRPMRWLPVPPPAACYFTGFSLGKRGCLGKTLAIMTMKTTLAQVLRHYRITADTTKLELQMDLLLKPASGCEITVELR